jgi:hypothetical protein
MARPDQTDAPEAPPTSDGGHSVRGAFVAVLFMAAFFAVTWFGMLALAMERR